MPSHALKASWEVTGGVIPGQPRHEFTKTWHYLSEEWERDKHHVTDMTFHSAFARMRAEVLDYYVQVSMPNLNNWARIDFIWY